MSIDRRAALALVALALAVAPAGARSPWTEAAGRGYAQLALYGILPYEELLVEGTDTYTVGREMTDLTLEAYAQYGLTGDWTAVLTLPLRRASTGDPTDATVLADAIDAGSRIGIGNVAVGLRRALGTGVWRSAVQVEVGLPAGGIDADTGIRLGIEGWSVVPTLSVGRGSARSYGSAFGGFAVRSDGYADQWRAGVEWGRRFGGERWWFVAAIEAVQSLRDGTRAESALDFATGLYVDDQEVVAPVIKVIHETSDRWGLLGTVQGGFAGDFVARSPFVGLAVFGRYRAAQASPSN